MEKYVTQEIDSKWGIFKEYLDDNFKVLREGQQMIIENHERFELETGQNFKRVNIRLWKIETRVDNIEMRMDGIETRIDSIDGKLSKLVQT